MNNKFKERRVEQWDEWRVNELVVNSDHRRVTEHNYSNPPELYEVLVAIEPQPFLSPNKNWYWKDKMVFGLRLNKEVEDLAKLMMSNAPLKPGDVIKGHKVLAVLGVEEREEILVSGEGCEYMGDEKWHFKYLTTKSEGILNEKTK